MIVPLEHLVKYQDPELKKKINTIYFDLLNDNPIDINSERDILLINNFSSKSNLHLLVFYKLIQCIKLNTIVSGISLIDEINTSFHIKIHPYILTPNIIQILREQISRDNLTNFVSSQNKFIFEEAIAIDFGLQLEQIQSGK